MKRFAHALSHELTLQYRNILIAAGAAAGAMMLVSMVTWVGGIEPVDLWPGYQAAMLIIGVLITSGEFGELRSPGHRIAFLLRPSTVWEKVATKILVSTLFVWVSVTLAFLLVSLLSSVIYLVVAGGERAAWALGIAFAGGEWPRIAWETLRVYLPIHAVFFFGSVYFRKHPAGRTLLAGVAWVTSYVVVGAITMRLVFRRYIEGSYPGSGRIRAMGIEFCPGRRSTSTTASGARSSRGTSRTRNSCAQS
jgi:hypothetical protein